MHLGTLISRDRRPEFRMDYFCRSDKAAVSLGGTVFFGAVAVALAVPAATTSMKSCPPGHSAPRAAVAPILALKSGWSANGCSMVPGGGSRMESIMGRARFDPGYDNRRPWNAGRLVGAKRPFKVKQIWAIRFYLDHEQRLRDRALLDLAIDSKLRGCDLVKLKIGDVVSGGSVKPRAIIVQQKTGKPVQFEIVEPARSSLLAWLERRGGTLDDFVFPSRCDPSGHLSTRQYARLVDEWVTAIGLRPQDYGTHSLRRTKASLIYKQTGNLRAIQILLGHTKIETTVRYLGVDVEDALMLAEGVEI